MNAPVSRNESSPNVFDGGGLMLCTGMAMQCNTSLYVGGSQIQYIIKSRRVVWLTGGQFLIGGCGCAKWCSASGDKQSRIQRARKIHSEPVKHREKEH